MGSDGCCFVNRELIWPGGTDGKLHGARLARLCVIFDVSREAGGGGEVRLVSFFSSFCPLSLSLCSPVKKPNVTLT